MDLQQVNAHVSLQQMSSFKISLAVTLCVNTAELEAEQCLHCPAVAHYDPLLTQTRFPG